MVQKWFRATAMAAAGVFSATASAASAAVVLNDNFDGYADQAAFVAAWPAVGTTSGTLSTVQKVSAPNSVHIPLGSTSNPRNGRSFTETGAIGIGDQIVFSFDYYDEAPTVSPYRNYANLQDGLSPVGTNQIVSLGLNNNQTGGNSGGQFYMARILGYSPPATDPDGGPTEQGTLGSGAYFKLNDFFTGTGTGPGARGTTAGWHNLKVVITTNDALSTDYYFYVDNALAERVLNVGTAALLRSYDHVRLGSGVSSTQGAFYDNVRVEFIPVPEPTSLAALALVGLLAGRRSRRRR